MDAQDPVGLDPSGDLPVSGATLLALCHGVSVQLALVGGLRPSTVLWARSMEMPRWGWRPASRPGLWKVCTSPGGTVTSCIYILGVSSGIEQRESGENIRGFTVSVKGTAHLDELRVEGVHHSLPSCRALGSSHGQLEVAQEVLSPPAWDRRGRAQESKADLRGGHLVPVPVSAGPVQCRVV